MALFKKPLGKTGKSEEKSDSTGTVLRKEEAYPGSGHSILEIADRQEWEVKRCTVYKEGALIDGRCLVEKVFEGGMGYVYITRDKGQGIRFAIKQPKEEILAQRDFFTRVLKEADAWTQIGMHPNIAYCYFVKNIEEVPHIFIEYVDGGNLRQWIEDGQCIEEKVNLDLAIQFCQGMEFAHSKGMIHRDIKPENILMTEDGILKITDFGLVGGNVVPVKNGSVAPGSGTLMGTIMGSPDYMAPEQWHDPRQKSEQAPEGVWFDSDIFSFGICMWEMFLGRRPFDTSAGFDLPSPPDPSDFQEDISEQLREILLRCVEPKRERRYRDFGNLREDLNRVYKEKFVEDAPGYHLKLPDTAADQLNNQGYSYYQLGNLEEAKNCFRKAIEIDKIHPQATYNLSLLEWREGAIDDVEVIKRLNNCKNSSVSAEIVDELLAHIHAERYDPKSAREALSPYPGKYEEIFDGVSMGKIACIRTLELPNDDLSSLALSADGRLALSGSSDGVLKIWDLSISKCICTLKGNSTYIYSAALSIDGRLALSGSKDNTLKLWDLSTGQCVRIMKGHTGFVSSVVLSTDGRLALSGSEDKTIKLWDISTGKCIRSMEGHTGLVLAVVLSADGHLALSGSSDNTLKLWDISSGQCIRTFKGHWASIGSVALSADCRLGLSGSKDMTIKLWELSTGNCIGTIQGYKNWGVSVAMSSNGRLALSDSEDKTLKLWDLSNGKCIRTMEGHTDDISYITLSADGQLALSCSEDKTLKLWDLSLDNQKRACFYLSRLQTFELKREEEKKKKEKTKQVQILLQEGKYESAFSLLRQVWDGINFVGERSILDIYSEMIKKSRKKKIVGCFQIHNLEGHKANVGYAAFSVDGRLVLSGSGDKTLKKWDLSTGKCIGTLEGHTNRVNSVALSADGRLALSGSKDKTMKLWDLFTDQCIRTIEGHNYNVLSVALSANGHFALSGSDGGLGGGYTIKLWDIFTGECIYTMEGHNDQVTSIKLSTDERLALSGSWDTTLKLWDISTGHCIRTLKGDTSEINSVDISADGRLALSGGWDKTPRLWDLATGQCIRIMAAHSKEIKTVAFSADGRIALSGSEDDPLKMWDISTGQCIRSIKWHRKGVRFVAFSPDDHYVISSGLDKTLILWRLIWDLEFPRPVDWDEGVRPYLEVFLRKHKGKWNEDNFAKFLDELGSWYGFGWVRPEGIRKELGKMTKDWKT